jgi:serine/threonine-protein kinase
MSDARLETTQGIPPQPGVLVADKYRLDREIGRGGMGVVFAAHHETLGHAVAVKLLAVPPGAPSNVVDRFLREARIVVRLRSEHVVRVYDVGALPDGTHYLVMDLLEGHDLMEHLRRRGLLPVAETVDLLVQACAGLSEAHGAGVVHRDVKLGNLFVTQRRDGSTCLKVLDFGISKSSVGIDADLDLTETAALLGSPMYMAPEQIRNAKAVDHRADLWALGIVAYRLLTGAAPFPGDTPLAVCAAITAEPPSDLRKARPDVPPALAAVLLRCLEKSPAGRPVSAAALALELAPFGTSETQAVALRLAHETATPVPAGLEARSAEAPSQTGQSRSQPAPGLAAPRRRLVWGLVAVGGLVAGLGLAFALGRGGTTSATAQPAVPDEAKGKTSDKTSNKTSEKASAEAEPAGKASGGSTAAPSATPTPSASTTPKTSASPLDAKTASSAAKPTKPAAPSGKPPAWGGLIDEAK